MATATGLTKERMLAIEAGSIVGGFVNGDNHLILTRHNGIQIDAGYVKGDPATALLTLASNSGLTLTGAGTPASPWVLSAVTATEAVAGVSAFATTAVIQAGTDLGKSISPGRLTPIAMLERSSPVNSSTDWNTLVAPGMYEVSSIAGPNAPTGVYGFGLLIVATRGNRTLQQYFPHNFGSTNIDRQPVHRSKYNASDWGVFASLMTIPSATDTVPGLAERATSAEVFGRTDNARFMTPSGHASAHGFLNRASAVAQTIPDATWTVREFEVLMGGNGTESVQYSAGVFTIQQSGIYLINAATSFATFTSGITGRRLIRIATTGEVWDQNEFPASNGFRNQTKANFSRWIAAGTSFRIESYHTQGASISTGAELFENYCNVTRLG